MTSGDDARGRRGGRLAGLFDVDAPRFDLPRRTAMLPVDGDEAPSADTLEPARPADPADRSDSVALGGTIDTVLGPLVVDEVLGRGGAAVVARAHHEQDGFAVAVKIFPPRAHERSEQGRRFARERDALERIHHENIVRVLAGGIAPDGRPYLVMELIRGVSLRAVLDEGQLPLARAASITRDLAAALTVAHEAGLLHRDLKPSNVMLTRVGGREVAKLVDFGCTRAIDPAEETRLTSPGGFLGTPAYAAPEQLRGAPDVDARADLYALGAVLFELLTGRRAFSGAPLELFEQKTLGPASAAPDAEGLGPLAHALLAPSREARPASALELVVTLTRIHRRLTRDGDAPIPDARTTPDDARRRAETAVLPHVPTQLVEHATHALVATVRDAERVASAAVSTQVAQTALSPVSTQQARTAVSPVSTQVAQTALSPVSTQVAHIATVSTQLADTAVRPSPAARRWPLAVVVGAGAFLVGGVVVLAALRALQVAPAPVFEAPRVEPEAAPTIAPRVRSTSDVHAAEAAGPHDEPPSAVGQDVAPKKRAAPTRPRKAQVPSADEAGEARLEAQRDAPRDARALDRRDLDRTELDDRALDDRALELPVDAQQLEQRLARIERVLVDGASWMAAGDARALERRLLDLRAKLARAPRDRGAPELAAAIDALARDAERLAVDAP